MSYNSFFYYNNGVHKPVLGMVKANESLGKGHRFRNITINSSSLEWHDVESYVNNERIGSFSINPRVANRLAWPAHNFKVFKRRRNEVIAIFIHRKIDL